MATKQAPRIAVAPLPATAPKAPQAKKLMTIADITAELKISRSTWERWVREGKAPRRRTLPSGGIRVERAVFDAWYDQLPEAV